MQVDAVVVGAGPNGLTAAVVLARAGLSVRVLEANATVGGAARTAEVTLPGFRHDLGSAVHPLGVGSPVFEALPLAAHGLRWLHPEVALAHPLPEGAAALLVRSVAETAEAFGRDARRYRQFFAPFAHHWPALASEVLRPIPHVPRRPLLLARFGAAALLPAQTLARTLFRTEAPQALFAGIAAHANLPLTAPASAAIGILLGTAGHAVGWPVPEGGAQAVADALVGVLRQYGGEVEVGHRVEDLRALPPARLVVLDLTPRQVLRLAGGLLPASYRRRLTAYRYGPAVFKVDYALREPIPWANPHSRKAGTVHVGGTLAAIAEAEAAVGEGRMPEHPFVLLTQPSVLDPSRAPEGQHTAWAYTHVPAGMDEAARAWMLERLEAQIGRFAPGFREVVLARRLSAPADLERENANLVDGDINGGTFDLHQLVRRPVLSPVPYQTPLPGVYLCSASTPPGGGVHGMCGYWAAQAALRDAGLVNRPPLWLQSGAAPA